MMLKSKSDTRRRSVFPRAAILCAMALVILTGLAAAQPAGGEFRTVVAEGVAALIPGKNPDKVYDEALKDAKRNAVQMGVGVLVDSATLVENYQMVSDKILALSSGYVRNFKVLSQANDGDLYRIVIQAEVAVASIDADLRAVLALKEDKGYPRIMLIGVEKENDIARQSATAQSELEDFLIQKGFDLVDQSQVDVNKARDAAMNPDDLAKAAVLGEAYGAEIVILFQAHADSDGQSVVHGIPMHSYRGVLDARMVYTDTAAMLGSVSVNDGGSAEGAPAAIRLTHQRTAKKAGPLVMEKILADWQKRVNKIEVIVSGIAYSEMKKVQDALKNVRRVDAVAAPRFEKGVATFQVQGDIKPEDLADVLPEVAGVEGLEVVTVTPGRVECRVSR